MLATSKIISITPAAGVTSVLLATPLNNGESLITELIACNLSAVSDKIRISINDVFIYHDLAVPGNTSLSFLNTADNLLPVKTTIKVYSLNGTISFTVFART